MSVLYISAVSRPREKRGRCFLTLVRVAFRRRGAFHFNRRITTIESVHYRPNDDPFRVTVRRECFKLS